MRVGDIIQGITMIKQETNLSVIVLVVLSVLSLAPSSGAADGVAAVTTPSADVTLSFTQAGLLAKVHVEQGDQVEEGQLLVQQDDAIERVQFAQIEAKSKNTSQLQASEASLAQKRVDLQKLEKAAARDAATELEVEHAKLEVTMAELSLEIAKLEHAQNQMLCDEARIRVEKMGLHSPIAGSIEKVHVEPGESVNALADVVRVVRTDPLWIDVPVPLTVGRQLLSSRGTAARLAQFSAESPAVRQPDAVTKADRRFDEYASAAVVFTDSPPVTLAGKITFVAAVADAASGTLLVRVEVPNKTGRPAGEHVSVRFPATK